MDCSGSGHNDDTHVEDGGQNDSVEDNGHNCHSLFDGGNWSESHYVIAAIIDVMEIITLINTILKEVMPCLWKERSLGLSLPKSDGTVGKAEHKITKNFLRTQPSKYKYFHQNV